MTAPVTPSSTFAAACDEADLARLASLSPLDYARVRKEAADSFNISVHWLDKAIEHYRKKKLAEQAPPGRQASPALLLSALGSRTG
jgi:hypothetical protein